MAFVKKNAAGAITNFSNNIPVDEKTKKPEPGWTFLDDGSAEVIQFLSAPAPPPSVSDWKKFRDEVEVSPEWLDLSARNTKACILSCQISNILWNDSFDFSGLALRWGLLFQEVKPTPAQLSFLRQKAIDCKLPQQIVDLIK